MDRIVLTGYFPLGLQGGAFRYWWRKLTGSDESLDQAHLLHMAGRSVAGCMLTPAARHSAAPLCARREWPSSTAPQDPNFTGVFLILVARPRRSSGR